MRFRHWIIGACAFLLAATAALAPFQQLQAQEASEFHTLPADHPFAAFIDSQNVAITKGATAEWRKMEWVALDTLHKRVYYAISTINKGMSDQEGDIQLTENPCGAIYMGEYDDSYNLASIQPAIVGGPYDESNEDYPCNADNIANPDNLFVDAKGNLWIGEDTDKHKNQFLWMWDGANLKRFASQPSGAEVTGLYVGPNGALFLNVQHPNAMNVYPFNKGIVGVVNGYIAGDDFTPVAVPADDDMYRIVVAQGEYQVLGRSGNAMPTTLDGERFGEVRNADGTIQQICNSPDGNMFLPVNKTGTEGYLYTNFECLPGGVSMLYIRKGDTGWQTVEGMPVDFTDVNGTWNNCGASVTPWNTGLTSEEYPVDVSSEWEGTWSYAVEMLSGYLGQAPNPYDYGYAVELIPTGGEEGAFGTHVVKHYAMGRFSWENGVVMSDHKTLYAGNDGTDRVMYKFVADTEGDLSAGTLYAAKVTQDGEVLNLEWIELGKGNDAEIATAIRGLDAEFVQP